MVQFPPFAPYQKGTMTLIGCSLISFSLSRPVKSVVLVLERADFDHYLHRSRFAKGILRLSNDFFGKINDRVDDGH